ncbi:hypothetical protein L7F22_060808 [Adiantum nelumboides]|nr:hypothetical protein [Adiantum nelumboides]
MHGCAGCTNAPYHATTACKLTSCGLASSWCPCPYSHLHAIVECWFKHSKAESDIWSVNEANVLLDLYEDKWISLNRGNFKAKHWTKLARDIQTRCAITFTNTQCQNKWDNIKKTFIKENQKEASSGAEPSRWEFYSLMEELIGDTPKVSRIGDGFTGEDFVNPKVVSLVEDENMLKARAVCQKLEKEMVGCQDSMGLGMEWMKT